MDSPGCVHGHLHNRYDFRHMLAEGQLLDQQCCKKRQRRNHNRFGHGKCWRPAIDQLRQLRHRTDLGQGIHVHCHDCRRHLALYLHMDSAGRMHRHIDNQYDIRHMLTEGYLLYQQRSQRQ